LQAKQRPPNPHLLGHDISALKEMQDREDGSFLDLEMELKGQHSVRSMKHGPGLLTGGGLGIEDSA
jgi:hypothetical protein